MQALISISRTHHTLACLACAAAAMTALALGCGQTEFPDALDPTPNEVGDIVSSSLSPQEKRDRLAAMGVDDVTINGLLADERLANQFGGSLQDAIDKVAAGRMFDLTPDEVQYYGDATDITTYADEEAQAIADFFAEHAIGTPDDLQAFLDDPARELPEAIDQQDLEAVFITTSIDDVRDKLP